MINRHPKLGLLGIVIIFALVGLLGSALSQHSTTPAFMYSGPAYGQGGGAASAAVVAGEARAVKGAVGGTLRMGARVAIIGGLRGALRGGGYGTGAGFGNGFGGGGWNGYGWSP